MANNTFFHSKPKLSSPQINPFRTFRKKKSYFSWPAHVLIHPSSNNSHSNGRIIETSADTRAVPSLEKQTFLLGYRSLFVIRTCPNQSLKIYTLHEMQKKNRREEGYISCAIDEFELPHNNKQQVGKLNEQHCSVTLILVLAYYILRCCCEMECAKCGLCYCMHFLVSMYPVHT